MTNALKNNRYLVRGRYSRRRGSMLIYGIYVMLISCAMISLAVDYGRVQMIKSQEQRCADAVARGVLAACLAKYSSAGYSSPTTYATHQVSRGSYEYQAIATSIEGNNPVDPYSHIAATYIVNLGSYYNSTFVNDMGSHGPLAVQVLVSRAAVNNNAVPLTFPLPNGKTFISKTCDVWATAIAMLPNAISFNDHVYGTQDPWLAGMPLGSTASDVDSVTNNAVSLPYGSNPSNGYDANTTLSVIPGSTITWTSLTGTSSHGQPPVFYDPNGQTDAVWWHLKDSLDSSYATEPQGQGYQNGIGDITAPLTALIGVFLDNNAPTDASNAGYATYAQNNPRDYTDDLDSSSTLTDNLHIQQPFYIGNDTNSAGNVRSFQVPANATRLFLGTMDGYQWANNEGSFTVVGSEQPPIQMVQ